MKALLLGHEIHVYDKQFGSCTLRYFRKGEQFELNDEVRVILQHGVFIKREKIIGSTETIIPVWILLTDSFSQIAELAEQQSDDTITIIAANLALSELK